MLDKLKKLFELDAPLENPAESYRRAQLAATALLLEVSHSDHQSSEIEVATILAIVRDIFDISESEIELFFSEAEQHKHDSTSLYEFTGIVNSAFDNHQKYELVCQLWRVAYADGKLDRYEDHTIRKVAELIYVSHSDFIKAKLEVAATQE